MFLSLLVTGESWAHPHVWVSVQTELVMEDKRIKAVRHHWAFDEAFSAFASQGLDENQDGTLSREELQPLAQVNVESLSEYDYFTDLFVVDSEDDGVSVFSDPIDYWLEVVGDQLVLHFTLPVVANLPTDKPLRLDVYDPSFFVDFSFAKESPAKLVNGPSNCAITLKKPKPLEDDVMDVLALIPADGQVPDELMKMTQTLANQVILTCKQ